MLASASVAQGQTSVERINVTAVRTSEPPVIDGRLIEESWTRAEAASAFTQRDPDEGRPATERTEVKILYDNDALYIAARLFDSQPELIGRRLSSRDGSKDGNRDADPDADRIMIYLDSMYDRLTGASFGVSAANVQEDAIIFNDTFVDKSWELLPYAAARAEFVAPEETTDPFNDGARAFGALGVDMKLGFSSNLTVDATVNPDFGQVEVDPAVVNLTAFETFFPEKRAFFLEGAQIFGSFGQGGSNSFWGFNTSDPMIFYSRRIGRSPQVDLDDTDFIDQPVSTTILGAVKLTGKTSTGWNIGLLEAVTGRETARTRVGAQWTYSQSR